MVTASGGADFYDEGVQIFGPEGVFSFYGGFIYAVMKRMYQKFITISNSYKLVNEVFENRCAPSEKVGNSRKAD